MGSAEILRRTYPQLLEQECGRRVCNACLTEEAEECGWIPGHPEWSGPTPYDYEREIPVGTCEECGLQVGTEIERSVSLLLEREDIELISSICESPLSPIKPLLSRVVPGRDTECPAKEISSCIRALREEGGVEEESLAEHLEMVLQIELDSEL